MSAVLMEAFLNGAELSTNDLKCDVELIHTKESRERTAFELLDARIYLWFPSGEPKVRHAIAVQFNNDRGPDGDDVAYKWANDHIDASERLDAYTLRLKEPADDFADFRWVVHSLHRN